MLASRFSLRLGAAPLLLLTALCRSDAVAGNSSGAPPAAAGTAAAACTGNWGYCLETRCCAANDYFCYEKDSGFAQCRPYGQCEPGVHPDDPAGTKWTCRNIEGTAPVHGASNVTKVRKTTVPGAAGTAAAACTGNWGYCLETRCCAANDYFCYEKDSGFAQCRPYGQCEPGVHPDDPAGTKWTCRNIEGTAPVHGASNVTEVRETTVPTLLP